MTVTVSHIRADKPVLTLATIWTNQDGEKVVEGETYVLQMSPAEMSAVGAWSG